VYHGHNIFGVLPQQNFTRRIQVYVYNMAEGEDRSLVALEHDLNQMGLSVEDLEPPEDGHFDRQAMVRVESARVMSQRFIERDRVKDRIIAQTKMNRRRLQESKRKKVQTWEQKTNRSPFMVDLLAENERLDEENRVRFKEEARQARLRQKRKEEAKNNIILQALTESCDLDALRREKRAIIQEERCLKALVDIEKSNGHRKAQMFAALRAEKQRHATKAEFRRKQFSEALEDYLEREAEALRQKHDVPPR
ncbi:unnamed protein product, partial [Ascophyllum nodosum]